MANNIIKVQTNREFNNGVTMNRTITLTIGEHEAITLQIREARDLHNILGNMLDMENNFEDNIQKDEELRSYAENI